MRQRKSIGGGEKRNRIDDRGVDLPMIPCIFAFTVAIFCGTKRVSVLRK